MSTSIHSFRGCHYEPSKGLDVSGIHASRSAANMLHLKPLNPNCTLGRGTEKRMISALVCSVVISLDYWPVC
jgi:hypothetical protein